MILYLGDDALSGAAGYLACVMKHSGISFTHIPTGDKPGPAIEPGDVSLVVLSDYPAADLPAAAVDLLVSHVQDGMGLLMIGGWESYFGGGYRDSAIADLLPVEILDRDDRINWPYPCVIEPVTDHEITGDLPFDSPPCIGGYNQVIAKETSSVLLQTTRYTTAPGNGLDSPHAFTKIEETHPLLVVGKAGSGKTAALMTDAAPHWVGGLVDWGDARVRETVAGNEVEVGNWYAGFFANLIRWCTG